MTRDYKKFYALCKRHGLDKDELVLELTRGYTKSLRAISDAEFQDLMGRLEKLGGNPSKGSKPLEGWKPKPGDMQRKKMISLARQMGWGGSPSAADVKAIVAKLDTWCLKQKFQKRLMQHTVAELNLLVTIFEEKVFADYLKALNK